MAEDAKKFDLIAALEGRSYPEEIVPVILDEDAMYEYAKLAYKSDHDPANKELEKERDELLETFKDVALRVTVRGVPRHVLRSIALSITKDFKTKFNTFGQPEENPEGDEAYAQRLWEAYVVLVEAPGGQTFTPGPEEITALREKMPQPGYEAVEAAINELRGGTKSGYEQIVTELPFLSQPSVTG